MNESDFFREDRPPQGPKPLKLVRVRRTMNPQIFTILSTSMWGVWTHWTGNKSAPCLKRRGHCPGCSSAHPKRWKGYLHCLNYEKDHVLVEFTARAANMLLEAVASNVIIRGLTIEMNRTDGGENGRLICYVKGKTFDAHKLPPPQDPLTTLSFLWGWDDLDDPRSKALG